VAGQRHLTLVVTSEFSGFSKDGMAEPLELLRAAHNGAVA
jgi:hypothetical protein